MNGKWWIAIGVFVVGAWWFIMHKRRAANADAERTTISGTQLPSAWDATFADGGMPFNYPGFTVPDATNDVEPARQMFPMFGFVGYYAGQ